MTAPATAPRATYRLQLSAAFDFDAAIGVLDYLERLGISHCYFAPYLAPVRGSTHGYDVVDPTRVNPELGGEAGHARLCAALSARGLAHMVDVVPNHMGIDSDENVYFRDVLEHGPESRYASFFDIDWDADVEGKLVLPILPRPLEECITSGHLRLARAAAGHVFCVGERTLPLARASQELLSEYVEPDQATLRSVLARQHYRLVYYQAGLGQLNYRRFMDIASLAALRVEDRAVFEATHARVLGWLREGKVHAVRVDHPDGLTDPEGYFHMLRREASGAWIVGEKVLAPGEWLPENWPLDGTTGYEFLNLAAGLFVDPEGKAPLTRTVEQFVGEPLCDGELLRHETKRLALETLLTAEVKAVVRLALRDAAELGLHVEQQELEQATVLLATVLGVGRTFARPGGQLSPTECDELERARALAAHEAPELAEGLLRLTSLLTRAPVSQLTLRFQQLSCAAMAKGVEDTAFYRHVRLVALNELGGDPERFGHSVSQFHHHAQRARSMQPYSMLCTSTHDTKRGEDTRLRIAALSELPGEFAEAVSEWSRLLAGERGPRVDRAMEYLFYQTLVGTWPIDEARIAAYMRKAAREAKEHTSWLAPDLTYEEALLAFVHEALRNARFVASLERFLPKVVRAARIHSLTQTLLKLSAPGIPDVYQGTELWDESLVDPDNRRPVAFQKRAALLAELTRGLAPEDILARIDEGLPKLWVVRQALALRKERPESLAPGAAYEPLLARDDPREHVIAFMRATDCIVVGQRLVLKQAQLSQTDEREPCLHLPAGVWHNRLTGESWGSGELPVRLLLARFPVALLTRAG